MSTPSDRSVLCLWLLLVGGLAAAGYALLVPRGLVAPAVPAFDGAKAFADLQALYALGPRHHGSPGHAACRRLIQARLREAGATVAEQVFTYRSSFGRDEPFTSVFARFGPGGAPPLILATHYDTQAKAHHDPDPAKKALPVPAANDGGSGVAVLLDLARRLGERPPPVPVVLAFFDGEDFGGPDRPQDYCAGSRRCAEALAAGGCPWAAGGVSETERRPAAVVVIDMVAERGAEFPRRQDYQEDARGLADAIWGTAGRLGVRNFVGRVDAPITDDHSPFLQLGIPALLIIDYDYGPANAWWHSTEDTPDKCDAAPMEAVGRVLLEWIYGLKGEASGGG